MTSAPPFRICAYRDLMRTGTPADRAELVQRLDEIFFAASNTQSFAHPDARAAFRERWLGRYLIHDARWAYVAVDRGGEAVGYLVGCLEDPARAARFADLGYFAHFAALTARFPAHLHVNLDSAARGSGIGSALVQRFAAEAAAAGAAGVHVVTGRGARNVGFYARNGFCEEGQVVIGGQTLLFLGKPLAV